eukprot:Amastigsp_a514143_64.p5 type:complete len:131 gc:universal Amastigsp_a514143_64:1010-618(-)
MGVCSRGRRCCVPSCGVRRRRADERDHGRQRVRHRAHVRCHPRACAPRSQDHLGFVAGGVRRGALPLGGQGRVLLWRPRCFGCAASAGPSRAPRVGGSVPGDRCRVHCRPRARDAVPLPCVCVRDLEALM